MTTTVTPARAAASVLTAVRHLGAGAGRVSSRRTAQLKLTAEAARVTVEHFCGAAFDASDIEGTQIVFFQRASDARTYEGYIRNLMSARTGRAADHGVFAL